VTALPVPADGLDGALRAGASGIHSLEAGTSLLIDSGCWLGREDFTTRFVTVGTDEDGPIASIDWEAAITALDAGELPCSGGERRILRLAASLAAGTPVSMNDALPGIDDRQACLVVQAVAHASGQARLSDSSLASLAGFLTTVDEFLRSPHMSARLTAFLSAAGHQHPGYDACLLIDDVSFTAARLRQIATAAASDQPEAAQYQPA
jgi:hypothetical protein